MPFFSQNPATGEVFRQFEEHSENEVSRRLDVASKAFELHRHTTFSQRAVKLHRVSELLLEDQEGLARMMVEEMGKPFLAARAEVEKCAWACRFYAENAETFLADENIVIEGQQSYLTYLPLGAILAVMPWNFPLWQVFRFAAPALMAGNVGLLKHAANVPQCALGIENLFQRAGFNRGEFQTLLVSSSRVAELIAHPVVAAVTLTGSEYAGMQVGQQAGKALKKTVLELGGSDPFIVMPSADLELAAKTAVMSRCLNNGQSCIAAKRFLIHDAIYEEFEWRFVKGMKALRMGNPLEETTELGPLATRAILQEVSEQVDDALQKGATLLAGGKAWEGKGFFYPPTVLSNVPEHARAFSEEVFGPVASLFRIRSVDDAIALANRHRYGLASSVWTKDAHEQQRFIRGLEAGATFVNAMVASDPRLPFGGIKKSGYGRELAKEGIREFVNLKTVVIRNS